MKFSTVKRYRRKHRILGALLLRNPVLVMGLDLPFVIAGAVSLRNAAAMSIQMFLIHVVTMTVGLYTCRRLPMWLRAIVNASVSTLVMLGAQFVIAMVIQGISNSLGMYLYLMAVNSMTIIQSNTIERKAKPGQIVSGAFFNAMGFALVVAVVALIREYFGNNTLWGVPVPAPIKISGLMIPFSGFILVGFLLAFSRFINKKFLAISMKETARKEARYTKIEVKSVEDIEI